MSWQLQRRLRQWLAAETGTIIKDWGGRIPVALVYPNRYFLGMSNLGFQMVYCHLNRMPQVVCERVFLPEAEDRAAALAGAGPLSVESQRPLRDFRIIAFSLAFENDYANLVDILQLGRVPLYGRERQGHDPLVVAGGVVTFLNPEPISPFIDLFLLGEAEALLSDFIALWQEIEAETLSRKEQLGRIVAQLSGAYAPLLFEVETDDQGLVSSFVPLESHPARVRVRRADAGQQAPAATCVFTPHTEFGNTTLVEIARGCGRGCRFCAAGFIYRPVRYRPAAEVVRTALKASGPEPRVGLLSAAVSDHPEIDTICQQLRGTGLQLSVSSLRADSLTPAILETLHGSGQQTLTIAPEAGSERLRRLINKNLTAEQVLQAAEAVLAAGIANLRLYFMLGLPTETEADVAAIIQLVKRLKHQQLVIARGQKRLGTLTLSISSFVPKPFTPFQWLSFCDLTLLKQRLKKLKRALGPVANVRVHADVPRWAFIQALLSRGDRRLAPLLVSVASNGGNWSRALKTVNVNPDFYVYRQRQPQELLPWDFIDHGLSKEYLWQEYQRALAGRTTAACDPQTCSRCGVCPTPAGPNP